MARTARVLLAFFCVIAACRLALAADDAAEAEGSLLDQIAKDEAEAAAEAAKYAEGSIAAISPDATHVQIATIDLQGDAAHCIVNTFCRDGQGRLLVAFGGEDVQIRSTDGARSEETIRVGNEIRVYSPDGELTATWPMPFTPQSLNVAPDLTVFVAGNGRIAKLDAQGAIIQEGPTPQIGDPAEYREGLRAEREAQARERAEQMLQMVEQAEQIIDKLNAKPEDQRSALDKLRLKNATRQLEMLKTHTEAAVPDEQLDTLVAYKLRVSGVAVSERDVFVAVGALQGYGYDIWRMDHDFANPTKVASGLRGCCGQMDIQCQNGEVFVAENSRHRVLRYSRDGELLKEWGQAERTGGVGFEGCCNPMNLRFGANGEVLTAESGCGAIKRFSTEGEYLGLVGNANLVGGCKHVAIAATADATRIFMLDVPRSQICILAPRDEAPAAPEEPAAEPAAAPNSTP